MGRRWVVIEVLAGGGVGDVFGVFRRAERARRLSAKLGESARFAGLRSRFEVRQLLTGSVWLFAPVELQGYVKGGGHV